MLSLRFSVPELLLFLLVLLCALQMFLAYNTRMTTDYMCL